MKKLEEKLFDILDWIPIYGANRLFRKIEKMPEQTKKSCKTNFYILGNGVYNAGTIGYSLYHLINYLVKVK